MLGVAGRGLSVLLLLPLAAFVAFCLPAAGAFDWTFFGLWGKGLVRLYHDPPDPLGSVSMG